VTQFILTDSTSIATGQVVVVFPQEQLSELKPVRQTMALVLKDRVKETTTTTGTGSFALAGAVTGYDSFGQIGNGNTHTMRFT